MEKNNNNKYNLKKVQPFRGRQSIQKHVANIRALQKVNTIKKQKTAKTGPNNSKWLQSEIFSQPPILTLNYQGIFRRNMLLKTEKRNRQSEPLETKQQVQKNSTKKKLEISNRNKSLIYWKKQQENSIIQNIKSLFNSLVQSDTGCICENPCPWAIKFFNWSQQKQQLIEVSYKIMLIKTNSIKSISPKHNEREKMAQVQLCWKQISKDMKRTQPASKTFQNQCYLQMMQRILKCYCVEDPQVGYVQGMNIILSGLLFHIKNQSRTYYVFRKLMQQIRDIYLNNFKQIYLLIDKIRYQIKSVVNDLYQHFQQLEVDLTAILFPWLASLMCVFVPLESLHLIYDGFIQQKWQFIIKLSLSILIYHKDDLKNLQDSGQILVWFSTGNKKQSSRLNWQDIRKYSKKLKLHWQ